MRLTLYPRLAIKFFILLHPRMRTVVIRKVCQHAQHAAAAQNAAAADQSAMKAVPPVVGYGRASTQSFTAAKQREWEWWIFGRWEQRPGSPAARARLLPYCVRQVGCKGGRAAGECWHVHQPRARARSAPKRKRPGKGPPCAALTCEWHAVERRQRAALRPALRGGRGLPAQALRLKGHEELHGRVLQQQAGDAVHT